jgi:recombination protein RecR
VLRIHESEARALADAIMAVKQNMHYCKQCFNLTEEPLCTICQNPRRDQQLLCIVEQPRDLIALEKSSAYDGLYHVLLGRIDPLENIGPDQITIGPLAKRVREGDFREVILATNPTTEGDGTALHITNLLADLPVKITRLARGLTSGAAIEQTNVGILSDALTGRQSVREE